MESRKEVLQVESAPVSYCGQDVTRYAALACAAANNLRSLVTDGTLPVEHCAVNMVPLEWHVLYARDVTRQDQATYMLSVPLACYIYTVRFEKRAPNSSAVACDSFMLDGSSTMGRNYHPGLVRLKSARSAPIDAQRW